MTMDRRYFCCSAILVQTLPSLSVASELQKQNPWEALFLPLGIVILFGLLAWYLLQKRNAAQNKIGPVQVLNVIPIGSRDRLLLVRFGESQLLLGATQSSITLLDKQVLPVENQQNE